MKNVKWFFTDWVKTLKKTSWYLIPFFLIGSLIMSPLFLLVITLDDSENKPIPLTDKDRESLKKFYDKCSPTYAGTE